MQDQEVGDGTTSVVILAAELLKRANDLVRNKIHPTSIIGGYRLAMREVSTAPWLAARAPTSPPQLVQPPIPTAPWPQRDSINSSGANLLYL